MSANRVILLRVISNLMENALRYAGNGLEVRTHYDSGHAHIEVLDRGAAIPATCLTGSTTIVTSG
ncbi:ATP-binding protein [Pseudomonas syringae]|uniref:ATP-binding protein n=1 Tax=Pseudomonas syringae TaxID=317 RepID=UPI0039B027AF